MPMTESQYTELAAQIPGIDVSALEAQCQEADHRAHSAFSVPVDPPADPELVRAQIAAIQDKQLFHVGDYQAFIIL